MAGRAANSLRHVNAVIEIDEVGQRINARPGDRRGITEARADRLEDARAGPDLRMTRHTGLRRWHSRRGGNFRRAMAIAAIQPELAHVVLVAE